MLDVAQVGLDVEGMVPRLGIAANVVNVGISVGRGDKAGVALSIAACIPIGGALIKGAKLGKGIGKAVGKTFTKNSAKTVGSLMNMAKKA